MSNFQFRCGLAFAAFLLLAALSGSASAQEQAPFMLRIFELNSNGRYTCTALRADRQLEQYTVMTHQGTPPPIELRRGPATDEEMNKAEELLQQPEFRSAASEKPNFPHTVIQSGGKFILALGHVDGAPKIVQFSDLQGSKTMPKYFKGFESFAEEIRRRKLPKVTGKVAPHCQFTND